MAQLSSTTVSRRSASFAGLLVFLVLAGLAAYGISRSRTLAPQASFGSVSLSIELATTTEAQERGLGGRTSIPDHYGMLFVFSESNRYGFWMKDMQVPIDIFWLDDSAGGGSAPGGKGQVALKVIHMVTNVSPESYPNVFYPTQPARYVLETRAGFAEKYGIATGTPLYLKNSTLVSR